MTRQTNTHGAAIGVTSSDGARLVGWKAIAANLGKDERTAKRWASELGLPVHRIPGRQRASVYAFPHELETWLRREHRPSPPLPVAPAPAAGRQPLDTKFVALVVLVLCVVGTLTAAMWYKGADLGLPQLPTSALVPEDVSQRLYDATYLWEKRTPETLQQAQALLLDLVSLKPDFADGYAHLAIVYDLMVEYGVMTPEPGYDQAGKAAETALRLDAGNPLAHTVLGDIVFFRDRDYAAGLGHFEAALKVDGQLGLARQWYASALMAMGRFDEASVEIERARRLDPSSRSIQVSQAMIALGRHKTEEARRGLLQLTANEPDYRSPYRFLAFAELDRGDVGAYLKAWSERFRISGDTAGFEATAAGSQAFAFGASYPEAMLASAKAHEDAIEPYFMAHLLALAGRWSEAAVQLDKTPTRHAFYYSIDPAFAAARATPDFRKALADVKLPVVP